MPRVAYEQILRESLMEVGSWNEPQMWPQPFREVVRHAKVLAAEIVRMRAEVEKPRAEVRAPEPRPQEPSNQLQILRLKELVKLVGLSRSTIYQGMAEGTFPKPLRLGSSAVGWRLGQIEDWLRARVQPESIRGSAAESKGLGIDGTREVD